LVSFRRFEVNPGSSVQLPKSAFSTILRDCRSVITNPQRRRGEARIAAEKLKSQL
jgi:hypothetical protein